MTRPNDNIEILLLGRVERIAGTVAHVSLVDPDGGEFYASCDLAVLGQGIVEGSRFRCIVQERDGETRIAIEPIPKRRIADDEWHAIRKETEEALRGYSPDDDYEVERQAEPDELKAIRERCDAAKHSSKVRDIAASARDIPRLLELLDESRDELEKMRADNIYLTARVNHLAAFAAGG